MNNFKNEYQNKYQNKIALLPIKLAKIKKKIDNACDG